MYCGRLRCQKVCKDTEMITIIIVSYRLEDTDLGVFFHLRSDEGFYYTLSNMTDISKDGWVVRQMIPSMCDGLFVTAVEMCKVFRLLRKVYLPSKIERVCDTGVDDDLASA